MSNNAQRVLAASLLLAAGAAAAALGVAGAAQAAPVPLDLPGGGLGLADVLGVEDSGTAAPASGDAQSAVIGGNASEQSIGS
ncbi:MULTISPECIES: hypothetical protein [unclassified Streptomyces]|uniref:hypothetical protein n=1 Tax=unclassified Streptomyces TaxID=2593676 RepID=UPI002E30794D|nr:hypothetical protein [Streptomyces sp. NBC_01268]